MSEVPNYSVSENELGEFKRDIVNDRVERYCDIVSNMMPYLPTDASTFLQGTQN